MKLFQAKLPRLESLRSSFNVPRQEGPRSKLVPRAHFLCPLVMLALVTLILSACGGADEELAEGTVVPKVLQAQRFEVVDAEGTVRAQLSLLEGGRPSLALMDSAGEARAWMFLNADGQPRLVLTDTPLLVLADAQDELRSVLRLESDGTPVFGLNDGNGATRSVIQLLSDGSPVIVLTESNGELLWSPQHEHAP